MLAIGKIIGIQRDRRTVDVFLLGGGTLKKVRVLTDIAGSHEGSPYLPSVDVPDGEPDTIPTGNDTYCVVGYLNGDIRKAIVLGLLFPNDFETAFKDLDVNKHMGGSYTAFDPDGFEVNRPDGTYIRIGTSNARVVDSATNTSKSPFSRTTGTATGAPWVYIKHSTGAIISISPAGVITMTGPSGIGVVASSTGVVMQSATSSIGINSSNQITLGGQVPGTDGTFVTADAATSGGLKYSSIADATTSVHGFLRADDQKKFTVQALGNITGATTIDLSLGDIVRATLTGNISVTLTNPSSDHDYLFEFIQDTTGSRTVTWTTTVKWAGGSTPIATTAINKKDLFLLHRDTADYLGTATLNF